jgi:hypothetical protein
MFGHHVSRAANLEASAKFKFSAPRRLKTFLRTTTSEERLNGLALAYIHKDVDVNLDRAIHKWDGSGHRIRLAFASTNK